MKPAERHLYIITATYDRKLEINWQFIFLRRLGRVLSQIISVTWIVVEDGEACRPEVQKILDESGVNFHYFNFGPTADFGNSQKNYAFEWIRDFGGEGIVYVADDDNVYELPLFEEIRKTQNFSVFPVGNLGPHGMERAILESGKFVRWDADWPQRRFPLDWAGFAFDAKVLKTLSKPPLKGYNLAAAQNAGDVDSELSQQQRKLITWAHMDTESDFISQFIKSENEMEFLCNDGQDCYVWYHPPAESCKDKYNEQTDAFHLQVLKMIRAKNRFDLSHLAIGEGIGTQPEDALLMYAAVKHMHPKTIVEFGFAKGYSARNFIYAMPHDCRLFSFDPLPYARSCAAHFNSKRFTFVAKRGEDFEPSDIENRKIDILFLDTNHEFWINRKIFKKVRKQLAEDCLIFVHDTGLFNKDFMEEPWDTIPGSFYVTEKGYAHRPQERMFVNYLKIRYPEFHQIHFHTEAAGRMGMTMLRRYKKLSLRGRSWQFWKEYYIIPQLKALSGKWFKRSQVGETTKESSELEPHLR